MGSPRTLTITQTREAKQRVHTAILKGMLESEIVQATLQEYPGVKYDTARRWVQECQAEISSQCTAYEENRLENLAMAEARLKYIYRLAVEQKDLAAAIKANEQLMRVQAVYPENEKARKGLRALVTGNTINIGGPPKAIEHMTDGELLQHVDHPLILTVDAANKLVEADNN